MIELASINKEVNGGGNSGSGQDAFVDMTMVFCWTQGAQNIDEETILPRLCLREE